MSREMLSEGIALLAIVKYMLRTGSYVIIVRAQFLCYSQSEGWALLM